MTGKSSDFFVLYLLICKIAMAVIPASVGYCDVLSRVAGQLDVHVIQDPSGDDRQGNRPTGPAGKHRAGHPTS